jgi:plastocyanin
MMPRLPVVILVLGFAFAAGKAEAKTIQVTIDKLVFSPTEIEATAGDTVEWINNDALAHTATVKGGFEVMIPAKQTATHVFANAETVDYYCRFHPNMRGRIAVAAP